MDELERRRSSPPALEVVTAPAIGELLDPRGGIVLVLGPVAIAAIVGLTSRALVHRKRRRRP